MTIEISIVDIICRIIAAIGVILCIILYFYDRHQVAKWFKENAKEDEIDYDLVEEFSQAFSSCNECEDKDNSV